MIARTPSLARYRLLALDWAALDHLSAGDFARALALYDEEIPLLDVSGGRVSGRNRLVAHLARAAAASGANEPSRALADLDYVDKHLDDPTTIAALLWPHASADDVVRAYRLITTGLRAKANRALGRLNAEAQSMGARRRILDDAFRATSRVEIARQAMLAEAMLAVNASQRHDEASAGAWLERALRRTDYVRAQANGLYDKEQLDVLLLAAELTVSARSPLVADLPKRVDAASLQLAARREPSLRAFARWLEVFGPLLAPGIGRGSR